MLAWLFLFVVVLESLGKKPEKSADSNISSCSQVYLHVHVFRCHMAEASPSPINPNPVLIHFNPPPVVGLAQSMLDPPKHKYFSSVLSAGGKGKVGLFIHSQCSPFSIPTSKTILR